MTDRSWPSAARSSRMPARAVASAMGAMPRSGPRELRRVVEGLGRDEGFDRIEGLDRER
ncbi:hypothetical protein OG265_13595 [Streptomyces sp. NBC_01208]|uniref:hypothetical protein n=1 Tax=Streptomyces sp. NBC_01208 TaxID=2903773 RepID=UPI002E0EF4D0|nr:hypothetical protein OG265_13595 [Streptomyces sp. NBC_01208]